MTTPEELVVLEHLAKAWDFFAALRPQHPSDVAEFHSAIHAAQNIVACRVAQRADPATFPLRADTALRVGAPPSGQAASE